jgi:lycopene beta-cyclase
MIARLEALQPPRGLWGVYTLVGAWALSMISLPILLWVFGEGALPTGVWLSVLLLVGASITIMAQAWGMRRALLTALLIAALGWAIEWLGSTSGFPFGSYDYTERLQPQLLGVPLMIPLAWLMMMPAAWAVAGSIVGDLDTPVRRVGFAAVSALAFTAWDLYLDPQMVNWGFWEWQPGQAPYYFDIPIVNYFGWFLAALVMTALARPPAFPRILIMPLLMIYGITIFLQTIGVGVFWGMPGAALCGLAGMGSLLVGAVLTQRRKDVEKNLS